MIKGDTSVKERQRLFDAFRAGEVQTLVVSKVANFSIDLPEASVAIQVSGSFGSRQEEAQRLGRLLRPEEGRPRRPLLLPRGPGHPGPGLRGEAAALPRRAGLRLPDHGRQGRRHRG